MKLYTKSELTYKNGYLVTDSGDIVTIDNEVIDLANELEEKLQRAAYIYSQPKFCEGPDMDEFERESEHQTLSIDIETPLFDARAAKTKALMDELDMASAGEKVNDALEGMKPLVQFVLSDSVVECEHGVPHQFDLPILGNPLKIDGERLITALSLIYDYDPSKLGTRVLHIDDEDEVNAFVNNDNVPDDLKELVKNLAKAASEYESE